MENFSLTIRLGVIAWTHLQFGASVVKDFCPKMTGESRIMIRDNGRRNSMKTKDLVQENLSNGRGCIGMAEHKNDYIWRGDQPQPKSQSSLQI